MKKEKQVILKGKAVVVRKDLMKCYEVTVKLLFSCISKSVIEIKQQ